MQIFDPKKLRSALEESGIVPTLAAAQANISPSSLSRYLSGEMVPSANALGAMAAVTGKPTDFFYSPSCADMHNDLPNAAVS